jgi:hypothetical protein
MLLTDAVIWATLLFIVLFVGGGIAGLFFQ